MLDSFPALFLASTTLADLTQTQWISIGVAILTLIVLEGLLSADNALVLAVLVRHLPKNQQRKALRYGMFGAFFFRFVAILLSSILIKFWFLEVLGGLYLLYLTLHHFFLVSHGDTEEGEYERHHKGRGGFWATVVRVELADIAFSIDSILAAVALARGLPKNLQEVDVGPFDLWIWIVFIGGVLGIITMRFVAGYFLILLEKFNGLADGAYLLVGWIGLKLIGGGLHRAFDHSASEPAAAWTESVPAWIREFPWEMEPIVFWSGMALILIGSLLYKPRQKHKIPEVDI